MEKYKLCPQCGLHVSPAVIECPDCEADLMNVPVVDDAAPEAPPVQQQTRMIRRCECGAENPPQARKCMTCGEDISDILPAPAQAEACCHAAEIVTLDGLWKTEIGAEPVTIGREQHGSAYLRTHSYVSRTHAQLVMKDGALQITSLSRSNPTFINNEPMKTDEVRTLKQEDEIGLGGCVIDGSRQDEAAYFVVKL